ncbi:DUF58 domain-containing protein [Tahibacter caeni]|uniref:DUF58 domain-containing protein n=1 Tax=Tahibacter caeni TaxID=1453545 RepID=UPI0021481D99|nr:DUF58 domain-containing protein [Tahibacter caeni]
MSAAAALNAAWLRLQAWAEQRLPALTRLRAKEPLPIRLDRRRIYVVPTWFGLVFASMLLIMSVGALNYYNNPALLLTAVLGSVSVLSMLIAFRTLDGVSLERVQAGSCHAGDPLPLELGFAASPRRRNGLRVEIGDVEAVLAALPGEPLRATLALPTQRRGPLAVPRICLWTRWPYGLFRAWSWLNPQIEALVYPRAETEAVPLPQSGREAQRSVVQPLGEDFGALREYRARDPLRSIAWKASARHDRLLVREPENLIGEDYVLDFDALPALDLEARIARLTRWVLMAEERRARYTLLLPGQRFGPDIGSAHRQRCLRALALL